jgi:hypothetical protein
MVEENIKFGVDESEMKAEIEVAKWTGWDFLAYKKYPKLCLIQPHPQPTRCCKRNSHSGNIPGMNIPFLAKFGWELEYSFPGMPGQHSRN